jgi:deazaflavin-dependent oxidoreductase (nitroreductase family)
MPDITDRFIRWIKYTVIPWYTGLGLTQGTITLEVRGRRTGKPTRVSLTSVRQGGERYLVSLYDRSQWVKNVRASGGQAVMISGRRQPIRLVEVPLEERASILLGYTRQRALSHSGEASARLFFGLGPNPTLEDMQAIAENYVVFRIEKQPTGIMGI